MFVNLGKLLEEGPAASDYSRWYGNDSPCGKADNSENERKRWRLLQESGTKAAIHARIV